MQLEAVLLNFCIWIFAIAITNILAEIPECREGFTNHTLVATWSLQEVTSPNYPSNYEMSSSCMWIFQRPLDSGDAIISAMITSMDIEQHVSCSYDSLSFSDDGFETKLATYCGSEVPDPVYSRGNYLYINFESDVSVQKQGFRLYVQLVTSEDAVPVVPSGSTTTLSVSTIITTHYQSRSTYRPKDNYINTSLLWQVLMGVSIFILVVLTSVCRYHRYKKRQSTQAARVLPAVNGQPPSVPNTQTQPSIQGGAPMGYTVQNTVNRSVPTNVQNRQSFYPSTQGHLYPMGQTNFPIVHPPPYTNMTQPYGVVGHAPQTQQFHVPSQGPVVANTGNTSSKGLSVMSSSNVPTSTYNMSTSESNVPPGFNPSTSTYNPPLQTTTGSSDVSSRTLTVPSYGVSTDLHQPAISSQHGGTASGHGYDPTSLGPYVPPPATLSNNTTKDDNSTAFDNPAFIPPNAVQDPVNAPPPPPVSFPPPDPQLKSGTASHSGGLGGNNGIPLIYDPPPQQPITSDYKPPPTYEEYINERRDSN